MTGDSATIDWGDGTASARTLVSVRPSYGNPYYPAPPPSANVGGERMPECLYSGVTDIQHHRDLGVDLGMERVRARAGKLCGDCALTRLALRLGPSFSAARKRHATQVKCLKLH